MKINLLSNSMLILSSSSYKLSELGELQELPVSGLM
jgi:hypothetical protein